MFLVGGVFECTALVHHSQALPFCQVIDDCRNETTNIRPRFFTGLFYVKEGNNRLLFKIISCMFGYCRATSTTNVMSASSHGRVTTNDAASVSSNALGMSSASYKRASSVFGLDQNQGNVCLPLVMNILVVVASHLVRFGFSTVHFLRYFRVC